ncbi:MAG: hypothetical protein V4549_05650 [Bacteroidota bacterium]
MIIIPASLDAYRSLKDRTLKITFETQELNAQELLGVAENLGSFGYLAFKKEPFKEEERKIIEQLETDYNDMGKTPSQRLRGVLYRIWEKDSEGFETFVLYYHHHLEKIITHFKSKLD